jgi:hypothetical protein
MDRHICLKCCAIECRPNSLPLPRLFHNLEPIVVAFSVFVISVFARDCSRKLYFRRFYFADVAGAIRKVAPFLSSRIISFDCTVRVRGSFHGESPTALSKLFVENEMGKTISWFPKRLSSVSQKRQLPHTLWYRLRDW